MHTHAHTHRYCIIDQSKLPHYRHAYDNVDRDEDDEINIAELDFALKAVNYDLISDAEMNYVHSVSHTPLSYQSHGSSEPLACEINQLHIRSK